MMVMMMHLCMCSSSMQLSAWVAGVWALVGWAPLAVSSCPRALAWALPAQGST